MKMTRIKVAVRVRPLSNREIEAGSTSIVAVENGNTLAVTNVKVPEQNAGDSRERIRRFTFDYCLNEDSTQDHLFEKIENVISQSITRRFHSCVLAYGQSSSGKTHTMMGFPHDPGLTPKLCHRVFGYLQQTAVGDEILDLKVSVSYLEIYNEKVRDLLRCEDVEDSGNKKRFQPLRVREHPKKGPYVQGLSEHPVTDAANLLEWLDRGNKQRRVAATSTNPQSSRSHSVFSINCDGVKLHLIDLAGSERAGSRCYSTSQFREGANINKSLVALGNVISALAEQTFKQAKGIRRKFVPYRDSVLTWLLKDTLGGNSNTVMVATVSPSSKCYNETVNTLRFGQRAKLIVSHPVVNEDPKEKTIRELRTEIARLRDLLKLSPLPLQLVSMSEGIYNGIPTENNKSENVCEYNNATPSPIPEIDETVEESKFDLCLKELNVTNEANTNKNKPVVKLLSKICVNEPITVSSSAGDDNSTLIESNRITPDQKICKTTTEKLLPVINVSSSIASNKPTKLRRTYSVDHTYTKIDKNKSKMFGSEESILTSSTTSRNTRSSSTLLEKPKSQDKKSTSSSSTASVRPKSLNKSNPQLPKLIPKRQLERSPKKLERAVGTEPLNIKSVEAKVDSVRKNNIKPRSQIVAAVTSRLYSKMKKKEAATDTDDINTYRNEMPEPKEFTICSNARARLRELTKKALRAHRQKHKECQTDFFPVLRLKEISTDVDDLRVCLAEVKNVETEANIIERKDASVECTILNHSIQQDKKNNSIHFTRTCGTQSSIELDDKNNIQTTTEEAKLPAIAKGLSNPISFTKYLREGQGSTFDVSNAVPTNSPIYTNTVNINISHNYINGNKISEDTSDDSAYSLSQNVCFPTPDLISNHNSLEQQNHEDTKCPTVSLEDSIPNKMHFGAMKIATDCFTSADGVILPIENEIYTVAKCTTIPKCNEKVHSIYISNVQAPEICLTKDIDYAFCKPLPAFQLDLVKPKVIEYIKHECIKLEEPIVLKSIVRQCINDFNELRSNREEIEFQSELPDSLDYHMANNKKVKFSVKPNQPENQRIVKAMSEFLEEATQLINNLSSATNNLSDHNSLLNESYELEVTLNDIRGLTKCKNKRHRKLRNQRREDVTQPIPVERVDCSTQCKFDHNTPVNKYEVLVEDSCRRLEEKINKNPVTQPKIHISNDKSSYNDDIMDQFSEHGYNPWDYNPSHSLNGIDNMEDSSLDSNPVTFSDYGSLPRKTYKRHRTPTCSPSAFLRQLTNMRRQIIESSRDELLGVVDCSNNH